MKKILISLCTAAVMLSGVSSVSAANDQIRVKVDTKEISFPDAKPIMRNNRTFVPVRFVSEALGAQVEWDAGTQEVKMTKGQKRISVKVGSTMVNVDDQTFNFENAPIIHENRTFVPLRVISEAFGAQVEWRSSEKLVQINSVPIVRNISGKDVPVPEKNTIFQAFHKSLRIQNGTLTGTVPKSPTESILVSFEVYFKDINQPSVVLEKGESFSYKADDIQAFGIFVLERKGKGKRLAVYAYRDPLSLQPTKIGGES